MADIILSDGTLIAAAAAADGSTFPRLTYSDAVEHAKEFLAARGVSAALPRLRSAIVRAYAEILNSFDWPFLERDHVVYIPAPQSTGTVSYDSASRVLTLSGATWPSWADGASVHVGGVVCDIALVLSASQVQLDAKLNPQTDLSGETYMLFRRWVALPDDFRASEDPQENGFYQFGSRMPLGDLLAMHVGAKVTGAFSYWAVGPNPRTRRGHALYVYPAVSPAAKLSLHYRRAMRPLRHSGHEPAEFRGAVDISEQAVTDASGTSALTEFANTMAGAILRISADTTPPTSLEGSNPYVGEHEIRSVESAAAMTLDTDGGTHVGVGYRITDPIDMDEPVWVAFLACVEVHLARAHGMKDYASLRSEYTRLLNSAKGAVQTEQPRRFIGGTRLPPRLRDHYEVEP
ncbi:MAG: hypothetical protein ACOY3P_20350 [Planctomycetota bacterium]